MKVVFGCPGCQTSQSARISPETVKVACIRCDWQRPVAVSDVAAGTPRRCLVCGCQDLWRQKGFPPRVGVAVVVVGAALYVISQAYYMASIGLGILLALALLDMLLFMFLPDVLVCYRCHATHRNARLDPEQAYFNLETAERYRQEALRVEASKTPRTGGEN